MSDNRFKQPLSEIAESVRNVDLYERSLSRSRRIGRHRAAAITGAALAVLGLAGAGLFITPRDANPDRPVIASPTSPRPLPSASAGPSSSSAAAGSSRAQTPVTPRSRSLSDLPGRVFYRSPETQAVVRLTPDGKRSTVLDVPNEAVAVSPGGDRIAYLADGKLVLPGSEFTGAVDPEQVPAWSSDGKKLLLAAPEPGVLTVATGAFKKLPKGLDGQSFRWSGDGTQLVYGTSSGRLKVAGADASSGRTVPVIGDPEAARNPDGTAACRPLSADRTGGRVTAPLESVGGCGQYLPADAVVDTTSGEVVALPVTGRVTGALFDPDGNLLIRTADAKLSVLAPNGTLLVQAPEPAAVKDLELLAYTR